MHMISLGLPCVIAPLADQREMVELRESIEVLSIVCISKQQCTLGLAGMIGYLRS